MYLWPETRYNLDIDLSFLLCLMYLLNLKFYIDDMNYIFVFLFYIYIYKQINHAPEQLTRWEFMHVEHIALTGHAGRALAQNSV
jgi:hypothetical protein